ncbi:anaerobic ribonucleoside-triphosphate reductase [Patescibacteria group bacterium]|nr:anaerobic ribonucleoside-triphosphate reductase [Patescibacteria group bacterium]
MQTTTPSAAVTQKIAEEAIQSHRTRCEVWTRVMGYHRPVANFNVGKKSEHYSRLHFSESKSANSEFTKKFS